MTARRSRPSRTLVVLVLALGVGCATPEEPPRLADDAPRRDDRGPDPAPVGSRAGVARVASDGQATVASSVAAGVGTEAVSRVGAAAVESGRPAARRALTQPDWPALGVLDQLPPARRVEAIAAAAEALPATIADIRSLIPQADGVAAKRLDETARLAEATRALLGQLAAQSRAVAQRLARADADRQAALERRRAALAERAAPGTTPVYPELSLEEARRAVARDVTALTAEQGRLLQVAAQEPEPPHAASEAALVAQDAERLSALELEPPGLGLNALVRGLALATRAAVAEVERTGLVLRDLTGRERETARVLAEAVALELERRQRRLEEVDRQVQEQVRRQEEAARLARRAEELGGEIARLQGSLEEAEARRRASEAQLAAVRSRSLTLDAGDDLALRSYRTTLDEYQRRLEAAVAREEAARRDVQALEGALAGERDEVSALRVTSRDRIERALRAWDEERDPGPLQGLLAPLEAATQQAARKVEGLREQAADAREEAAKATDAAARLEAEGVRQAAFLRAATPGHAPLLSAIEQVRSLLEGARRSEAQLRSDQARALEDAASRAGRDFAAQRQELDEVRAALKATQDARRLDSGALRSAWIELRDAWIAQRAGIEERLAASRADDEAARRLRWRAAFSAAGGLLVLLGALALWVRARRRAATILDAHVDADKRLPRPAERYAFLFNHLLAAALPWLGLLGGGIVACAGLGLPRPELERLAAAALALVAVRLLACVNDLALRERRLRPLAESLSPTNRASIHARLRLALAAGGPLLALFLVVQDQPTLWATAVVLRAALSVLVVATLAAVLHVARDEVAVHLRVAAPPAGAEDTTLIDWARGVYNRAVEHLLLLLLLDGMAIGALWVAGWVEPAALLLRGTVQTILSLAAALLLVAGIRWLNRRLLTRAFADPSKRSGVQIVMSMLVFLASRLLELAIAAAACVSVWAGWGGDIAPILAAAGSERVRLALVAAAKVVAILAVAYYANRLVGYTIDTFIDQTLRTAGRDVARRRDTFAPLAKSAARYVVSITAIIYSATVAGLDLVSVMAGLGVIGLAVAFGAQALVKDVITGVFLIMDDVIAVGDVVKIGDVDGFVEHVGVRVVTLRNEAGIVISVPNGSIDRVHNFNRGWNRALVNLNVAYGTNVEHAMAVLKEVADEYHRQRPELVLEAPEVQGVLALADSSVVLKLRCKTSPLAVWQVERDLRLRALVAFEDQGIEIPFAQQVVHMRVEPGEAPAVVPGVARATLAAPGGAPADAAASAVARGPLPLVLPASASATTPAAPAAAPPLAPPAAEPAPDRRPALVLPPGVEPLAAAPAPAPSAPPPSAPLVSPPAPPAAPPPDSPPSAAPVEAQPRAALLGPDGAPLPATEPAESPRRPKRVVLSDEARARLREESYAERDEAPAIPAEMADSLEIIQRHRVGAEAERTEAQAGPAEPGPAATIEAAKQALAAARPPEEPAEPLAEVGAAEEGRPELSRRT